MGLIDLLSNDTSLCKNNKELLEMIVDSSKELDNVIKDIVYKTNDI